MKVQTKVCHTAQPKKGPAYPCIKISSQGHVVLFVETKTGVCLHSANGVYAPGYHSDSWYEDEFEPLVGHVTLSNEV